VRGVVRASNDVPLSPFMFVTARQMGVPPADSRGAEAIARSDGTFALSGLLPGTYRPDRASHQPR
jgi:hypothetical protein